MPAGNGLSVCEMLSTDETYGGMPIVVLTGRTDPDTICRCHAMCAYYVEKCPDIWTRLEPLLNELLDPAQRPAAADAPASRRRPQGKPIPKRSHSLRRHRLRRIPLPKLLSPSSPTVRWTRR